MAEIMIMGELLVEIMRAREDVQLYETGETFRGPFPSGAPGIFASTAARLGHGTGIISGVGNDDFGKNILDRLNAVGVDTRRVLVSDAAATGAAFVTYFSDGERKLTMTYDSAPLSFSTSFWPLILSLIFFISLWRAIWFSGVSS